MIPPEKQIEILKERTAEIIKEEELFEKIKKKGRLRVKLGIDPTAPDIHLGFAVVLRKLRQFQDLGHTAVLIVGDFTARVGDPSGRSKTRPQLSKKEVENYMKTYKEQLFKILRKDNLEIRYNSEWFENMDLERFISIASKMTVARILERDDFEKRYKEGIPIAVHEFLYPILQAYDSVMVEADVELGGTDQKFNLVMGRHLQLQMGQEPQVIMLMPLLIGTDGKLKMSKSYKNYIGITEPPKEIFGKIMSIPDDLILDYYRLTTDLHEDEIKKIEERLKKGENPRDIKADLAQKVVEMYYSKEEAIKSREEFDKVFKKREFPEDAPEYVPKYKKMGIIKLLRELGVPSNSEARRLIQQGAVKINGEKIEDPYMEIIFDKEYYIKIGKRQFYKIMPYNF